MITVEEMLRLRVAPEPDWAMQSPLRTSCPVLAWTQYWARSLLHWNT